MHKVAVILVVLATTALAAISTTSCFVHRRSDDLRCTTTSDCTDGLTCDNGYCLDIPIPCPSPCTSCDLTAMTCRVECTSGHECGNVQCPAGFDCTIRCNNPNSCGAIDCAVARSCDIDCSSASACQNINCGPAPCDITCSGPQACPSIDCAASCRCDVTCNNMTSCPSMSCPTVGVALCTKRGSAGAACDSTEPNCDRCF